MLNNYYLQLKEREEKGIPGLPLDTNQITLLIELLKSSKEINKDLLNILINRVSPGVDEAAQIKADFLGSIISGNIEVCGINKKEAVKILGTMQGGYNLSHLILALDNEEIAELAANELSKTILIFNNFEYIREKAEKGNSHAKQIIKSWADAKWFLSKEPLAEKITMTVFKVDGETNTDDLSPAPDAWSRPDIPLHALAMYKMPRVGIIPDKEGELGPLKLIEKLKKKGYPLVFAGDVIGTGSSRKSATNSVLWHIGEDIPFVPNKRRGGVVLSGKMAPIFFNTMEDSGALPIENVNLSNIKTGDIVDIYPYKGEIRNNITGELLSTFELKTEVILDEVRAGGRIPLIIGRKLTSKARKYLNLPESDIFIKNKISKKSSKGYTLAQKIIGKACGVEGVRAGDYCEPKISSVGSQDTTGGMTRDELKDLACLKFSADLVMQSFCHTCAYPKEVDIKLQKSLPAFMISRKGVALKPGDGIIHSWLNRMLVPDTVGTGGDSHTRFPLGLSFPGGSGLVAFAAATGIIPLDMPESVLVKFTGKMQPGITLRDMVHAIPYYAIKKGLLTIDKTNKKNIFSGRILEIQGLSNLTAEQAFELADASAERSSAACTIDLSEESVKEYLTSNVALLKWMVSEGYQNSYTLKKRIEQMEEWLKNPKLLRADSDAEYAAVIEINMNEIKEPILCAPNDPDDAKTLSEVAGTNIDEVFIGSCMTNIGHFRAAAKVISKNSGKTKSKLWVTPPTKMDSQQLKNEGIYNIFGASGARIEIPGCSLCMGNQARIAEGSTAVSTSTRNFPNRLGTNTNVFLGSAELASVAALLGKLPNNKEYLQYMSKVIEDKNSIYKYLNFNKISDYETKKI